MREYLYVYIYTCEGAFAHFGGVGGDVDGGTKPRADYMS